MTRLSAARYSFNSPHVTPDLIRGQANFGLVRYVATPRLYVGGDGITGACPTAPHLCHNPAMTLQNPFPNHRPDPLPKVRPYFALWTV